MERVIITGATSLLGVALIKELLFYDVEIIAVSRRDSSKRDRLPSSPKIIHIECNLDELRSIKIREECDTFYHIAWENTGRGFVQKPWLQVDNIKYELEAVELAKRCGCRKFIGCGSQAEYGYVDGFIDKSTRFNPNLAYGFAKLAAGGLSRILCEEYGITHIWGRILSMYGENEGDHTVFKYAINCFRNREDAYFSSGTQLWDYLNEKDAGRMFYLLGEKGNQSKSYLIAYGESRPLRDYIEIVAKEMNAMTLCHFDEDSEYSHPSVQADISEFINDFNFKPSIRFEDGCKSMINKQLE